MGRSKKKHTALGSRRATVLIIVRHAVTPLNEKGIVQGVRSDAQLSAVGRRQAKMLAIRLQKYKIDTVYSSDMKRCRQTIKQYIEKTRMPVHYIKELRERDYGIFDGKAQDRYTKWKKGNGAQENFDLAPPGGESFRPDVMRRVGKVVKYILKREIGRTILICGHNSINKALMLVLFSQDPKLHYKDYTFDNAGITIVRINKGNPRLGLANSTSHLISRQV